MALFWAKKKLASQPAETKALLFDTFGTTVDWLSSLTALGNQLGAERNIDADWAALARDWRSRYKPAIKPVREGKRPWTGFDTLHREQLDQILSKHGAAKKLSSADRDRLTQGWHQLAPWPDVVPGLHRLKKDFILGPLSNGTLRQMVDLARFGNLPWDVVFGADLFRTYKPDPKLYLSAASYLDLAPENILMVAAHNEDLQAAGSLGLQTCFVHRPTEDPEPTGTYTHVVSTFEDLARSLNAV